MSQETEDKNIANIANQKFEEFQKKLEEDLGVQFQLQLAFTAKGIFPTAVWVKAPSKKDE